MKLFCSCDVDSVCWFSFDLFLKCTLCQMTSAPKQPVLSPGCDPANNMPGKLTPYLIHPQKIRNTAKTVILWNIITIASNCFLFPFMYFSRNLFLWCKAEFSASLLQSLVSRDPSEIILIIQKLWYTTTAGSHNTLQPKTGCPLKLSRAEPGQYLDGRPPVKTRLLLEEVLVRPAGDAHPVVCVGPNTPV